MPNGDKNPHPLQYLNTNIKILSNGDIGEFNRKNRNIKTVKEWIKI